MQCRGRRGQDAAHGCVAVTVTFCVVPQCPELIPPVATRTFEPGIAKSTLLPPLIDKLTARRAPRPPAQSPIAPEEQIPAFPEQA